MRNEEPQTHFRNECLCRAMVDFNMIDTVSRGIKKMFNEQWRRHFPMPDYEIDQIKKIASKQQPMSNFRCIQLRNIKQLPVDEDGLINKLWFVPTRTYNLFFIKMYQSIIFDVLHRYI